MIAARIADSRFYPRRGPFSAAEVAKAIGSPSRGSETMLTGVAPLQHAAASDISFLDNRRYLAFLGKSLAGAIIVHPDLQSDLPHSPAAIVTVEPYAACARVCALFHPESLVSPGVHPSAIIEEGASIDPSCEVGPNVVISSGVVIGT